MRGQSEGRTVIIPDEGTAEEYRTAAHYCREEMRKAETRATELEKSNGELREQISQFMADRTNESWSHQPPSSAWTSENARLKSEVARLTTIAQQALDEGTLFTRNWKLRSEVARLDEKLKELEARESAARMECADLKQEIATIKELYSTEAIISMDDEMNRAKVELKNVRDVASAHAEVVQKRAQEIRRLEDICGHLQTALATEQARTKELTSKCDKYKESLEFAIKEIGDAKQQVDALVKERDDAKSLFEFAVKDACDDESRIKPISDWKDQYNAMMAATQTIRLIIEALGWDGADDIPKSIRNLKADRDKAEQSLRESEANAAAMREALDTIAVKFPKPTENGRPWPWDTTINLTPADRGAIDHARGGEE